MKSLLNKMSRKRGQDLTKTQKDRMLHLHSTRLFIHLSTRINLYYEIQTDI